MKKGLWIIIGMIFLIGVVIAGDLGEIQDAFVSPSVVEPTSPYYDITFDCGKIPMTTRINAHPSNVDFTEISQRISEVCSGTATNIKNVNEDKLQQYKGYYSFDSDELENSRCYSNGKQVYDSNTDSCVNKTEFVMEDGSIQKYNETGALIYDSNLGGDIVVVDNGGEI